MQNRAPAFCVAYLACFKPLEIFAVNILYILGIVYLGKMAPILHIWGNRKKYPFLCNHIVWRGKEATEWTNQDQHFSCLTMERALKE